MCENLLYTKVFYNVQKAMDFAGEHCGRLSENSDGSWTVSFYYIAER